MIEVNRRDIARFRAVVRRCVAGRPRGFAPPIVVQQNKNGLTLSAVLDEAAIALRFDASASTSERFVVPFTALAALEGPGDEVATFESTESGGVICRWQERGEAKQFDCEATPVDADPPGLPPVGKLQAVDRMLLTALHACGQSASRESASRFALVRLQLRGPTGEIAGTDGRQLLLWGGFTFPFEEDLLIPALPVFGSRELAGEEEVGIGRTAKYVVVAVGTWTIWLTIDSESRFPDVMSVIPRSPRAAKLAIDEVDATALLRDLHPQAGSNGEVVPATLEFGPKPLVRWPEGTEGRPAMISLSRSVCSGPATTVQLDPKYLLRALSYGLREVRCASPDVPVLFHDRCRSYLVANFGPSTAPAARPALPALRSSHPQIPPSRLQQGETVPPERNGQALPEPPPDDLLNPMVEAEALRLALVEAARRVGRLITSLRQLQKQRRALHAAWSSLRHLSLGPKEES